MTRKALLLHKIYCPTLHLRFRGAEVLPGDDVHCGGAQEIWRAQEIWILWEMMSALVVHHSW